MKDFPLVSIIIPCYNDGEYVGEAIESALRQTYANTEVIVIDDGSTDDSLDVIRSFDEQITWRTGENEGACHARNWGLRLASGEFIKFLDSDDLLFEGAVGEQVEQMRGLDDDYVIVFGDGCEFFNGETIAEAVDDPDNWKLTRPRSEGEGQLEYLVNIAPQTSLPLHRRQFLQEVGGFDERLPCFQEFDLHLRLCCRADVDFRYVPAKTAILRWHDKGRITTNGFFDPEPKGRLNRVRRWVNMIQQSQRHKFSDSLRRYFAKHTWHGGRIALRKDRSDIAEEYFNYARNLHEDCVSGSSPFYSVAVRVMGPTTAEQIGTLIRRAKA